MAFIGYPYVPATQDLFLYEDYVLTWTGGSATVKRPIGWNPTSPLYGYRRSLGGLSAKYRTLSTTQAHTYYDTWNDPALDVNKPAFYNSWPHHLCLVTPKFMLSCHHSFGDSEYTVIQRDPSNMFVGPTGYAVGSYLAKSFSFRWLGPSNEVLADIDAETLMHWYTHDPAFPSLNMATSIDLALMELNAPLNVPPLLLADLGTARANDTVWHLDGSDKIVRTKLVAAYVKGKTDYIACLALTPGGAALPASGGENGIRAYLHDSGSMSFIEVTPPTSPAAGDGVLAMVQDHVYGAGDLIYGNPDKGYRLSINVPGVYADTYQEDFELRMNLVEYLAFRGEAMTFVNARRNPALGLATQAIELTILQNLSVLP